MTNNANEWTVLDYNAVLTNLQHYMLDEETINRSISVRMTMNTNTNVTVKQREAYSKPRQIQKVDTIFRPVENDSLFWCFFIMKNGDTKYELLENKNMLVDKRIKIEYVEMIRKEKHVLKAYKFATLSHIENKLANDARIDINTFLALCAIENINVLFINKRTYFELSMTDNNEVYIVYCLDNYRFGYEQNTNNKADELKTNLYKLDSITKPIKSIANYKLNELVDICTKLLVDVDNTESNKPKNKNELYESIIKSFAYTK
jgi:hypothetical protein